MNGNIDITLVANAGVLIEHNGIGLLVDGMHSEEGPFSKVPGADLELMRRGQEPFANLDYILFTHEHPDHLTPGLVLNHVRQRPVKGLFLPNERHGSQTLGSLLEYAEEQAVPHRTMSLEPGETREFKLSGDLSVTAIGTRHMGPQYQAVRNDCLLLSLEGMNLLFTGDADHVAAYYELPLRGVTLDAVFVNPLFFHNADGQAIINEIFQPRHVIVYHMPFPEEDTMRFTALVDNDIRKHARPGIQAHALNQPRQRIRLLPDSGVTRNNR
ncbi:MBL fold metallo-hydrolase [Pseudodesulfovibrio cashew]|uniref:MBL fold metallo-hydrolase n=1 Tax=Pseudodesulfovibrio cashew TaxID=2678688 RepID=A0A6I6JCQ9_9BACT|nr:MBL fold metallo-hydrolase [Pseudodesulfovibrio cashew]QGY38929.1 MBL fold metallo-hydrolase [Pseudodesulfovibrio cashew]